MRRFKRIVPILFAFILCPIGVHSGDLTPGRLVRTSDTELREGLVAAHLVLGEPVEALAVITRGEDATAKDHYYAGTALALTGRFIKASEAFHSAILKGEPGSETHKNAVLNFIKMSSYNPSLELPSEAMGDLTPLDPDLSLALSGYLADRGDRESAHSILQDLKFKDPGQKVVSGILSAGHLAVSENWEASSKLIGKVKGSGSSTLIDLLNLSRGYHYLQSGQPDRARNSFQAILPSSPYTSEALHGKAWSMIKAGDLQEASIVLEELIDRHRYSRAAGEGVLDLAITYRDLGLYDRAETILDQHLKRLKEVNNWLGELRELDLGSGSDIIVLLESAIDGTKPDRDLLLRTPDFVRQWIIEAAADHHVKRTTALRKGVHLVRERAARLNQRIENDALRVKVEVSRVEGDISGARATMARLEDIRNQLKSIKDEMSHTLQSLSLDSFASRKAMLLIQRTKELKLRLALMENSVSKAQGFSHLVEELSESVTVDKKEDQLNRIRKKAYEGLISSRVTLRRHKNALSAMEGRLWLEVKGEAISLERKTSLRVTSGRTRAGQASAETAKALGLLDQRLQALEKLDDLLSESSKTFDLTLPSRLNDLEEKIERSRSQRLLALAARTAQGIRNSEAFTLYTSADIEITRMESIVKSLQEAVQ